MNLKYIFLYTLTSNSTNKIPLIIGGIVGTGIVIVGGVALFSDNKKSLNKGKENDKTEQLSEEKKQNNTSEKPTSQAPTGQPEIREPERPTSQEPRTQQPEREPEREPKRERREEPTRREPERQPERREPKRERREEQQRQTSQEPSTFIEEHGRLEKENNFIFIERKEKENFDKVEFYETLKKLYIKYNIQINEENNIDFNIFYSRNITFNFDDSLDKKTILEEFILFLKNWLDRIESGIKNKKTDYLSARLEILKEIYNNWDAYYFSQYNDSWNYNGSLRQKKHMEEIKEENDKIEIIENIINNPYDKNFNFDYIIYDEYSDKEYSQENKEEFRIFNSNSQRPRRQDTYTEYFVPDNENIEDFIINQLKEYKKNNEQKKIVICLDTYSEIEKKIMSHKDFQDLNNSLQIYFLENNSINLERNYVNKTREDNISFLYRIIEAFKEDFKGGENSYKKKYYQKYLDKNGKIFLISNYDSEITFYLNEYMKIYYPNLLLCKYS
jgi:hypothetical protein